MRKRKMNFRHKKTDRYISNRIYVNRSMTKVTGVYPIASKSVFNTLFVRALINEIGDYIMRCVVWLAIFGICCLLSYWFVKLSSIISTIIMVFYFIMLVFAQICYIVSFRGNVLKRIESVSFSKIEGKIEEYLNNYYSVDSLKKIEKNALIPIYNKLDQLSKVADIEGIRERKVIIMQRLSNDFYHDWDFETDRIMLNNNKEIYYKYIRNVYSINKTKIGPITMSKWNEWGDKI